MNAMKLEDLKKIASGKATTDDILEQMEVDEKDVKEETKKQAKSKKKYLSWEWIKTDWWWKWEWEKDKEWRPILRKECSGASMYHISRPEWVYEEWEWKDAKQYNVWCIKFKDWKEVYWYKKDWKLNQVRFIKKPFDLANRLYVTGHAYQQKWQSEPQG